MSAAAATAPSGVVTFLVTDVEGSTRRWEAEGGGDAPSVADVWFDEERSDVGDWLREHGWQVEAIEVHDLMAQYHRTVPEEDAAAIPQCVFVSGQFG